MQNIKPGAVFELDKQRPSHLLNIVVKSSHGKIWNILVVSQTLWILIQKKNKILTVNSTGHYICLI